MLQESHGRRLLKENKNTGEFDFKLLAEFDQKFLDSVGFTSEELDEIFNIETTPEDFDIKKELQKVGINEISAKTGDIWLLGDSKLMVGDSTKEEDVSRLMGNEKADMCFTDPPYILDYLKGKRRSNGFDGKSTCTHPLEHDQRINPG